MNACAVILMNIYLEFFFDFHPGHSSNKKMLHRYLLHQGM